MLAGMLGFGAVPAIAGTTASVTALSIPAIQTSYSGSLGTILVDGMGVGVTQTDTITMAVPGGVTLNPGSSTASGQNTDSVISIPEYLPGTTTPNALWYGSYSNGPTQEVQTNNLNNVTTTATSVSFQVYAEGTGTGAILLNTPVSSVSGAGSGPINFYVQDTDAIVPAGNIQVGTVVSPGTITTVTSTASISQGGTENATINLGENTPGSLEPTPIYSNGTVTGWQNNSGYYEIKLPSYFEWQTPVPPASSIPITSMSGGWTQAISNTNSTFGPPTLTSVDVPSGTTVTGGPNAGAVVPAGYYDLASGTTGGYITVGGTSYEEPGTVFYSYGTGTRELYLAFGSSMGPVGFLQITGGVQAQYNAPNGNIVATVKGTDVGVTPGNITVGTTGNYSVTTTAGTGTVILGQQGQTLPTFSISESVAGTLIVNRSITLTLPSGMYWTPTNLPIAYTTTGSVQLSAVSSSDISSNGQSLTYNITQADTGSTPSTIEFESGEVDVDTSATPGPVNVTVVGSGLNETVQAGTLVSSVTATAASNPLPSVLVGNQNQSVSNFTLTETKSGNMEAYDLWIIAPNGVTFDGAPTASVTSGDLSIGAAMLSNYSNGINNEIVIPVTTKSSNNAPGTISVSGLSINLSSSVPTGPISLEIGGPALVDNNTSPGWPTKGITYPDQITGTYVASVPVANVTNSVVTTTPTSPTTPTSGSADFTVGATVYSVNGVQYVMDVAPYISNGRTFVPVRYLGDALGATVSWDAATQTVTLTKGSNTETMNIGSTTMTVNGAAVTMDVAPVIVNSRTMLPARFVAQGLGAQVGWNPATQEVLITW
jgi:hypothetical protein